MTVGQEIRRLREERGWSQAKLGVLSGTGPSGISQIETGRRNPSAATLQRIAEALGVGIAELFPKGQAPLPDFEVERRGPTFPEPPREWLRAHNAPLLSLTEEELSDHFAALYSDMRVKFADRINREWQAVEMARDLAPDPNAAVVRLAYAHAQSRYLQATQLAPISTAYDPDDPEKPQHVKIILEKPKTPAQRGSKREDGAAE